MDNVVELINNIESGLSDRYQVLEGDYDIIYVKDKETNIHYTIHVSECDD